MHPMWVRILIHIQALDTSQLSTAAKAAFTRKRNGIIMQSRVVIVVDTILKQ